MYGNWICDYWVNHTKRRCITEPHDRAPGISPALGDTTDRISAVTDTARVHDFVSVL